MGENMTTSEGSRKLILQMGLSLDGFVARPVGYGAAGWGPPEDAALKERNLEALGSVGLFGRPRLGCCSTAAVTVREDFGLKCDL